MRDELLAYRARRFGMRPVGSQESGGYFKGANETAGRTQGVVWPPAAGVGSFPGHGRGLGGAGDRGSRCGSAGLYRPVRFALMLVGDQSTAEDVVQDAFLGLYRAWDRVRDPDAVLGYLRTAVVNGGPR